MASELRVNTINSRTGFGTITVSETGQDLVGITTIENLTTENTLVGAAASFTGNVQVGGVLTYEDVTNIDSVGLITARSGIEIGARPGVGASISADGNMIVSGISTFGGSLKADGGVDASTQTVTVNELNLADSIVHGGDANTKIRFPAADTITAETAGSERFRITSAGLVGIGENNPSYQTEVKVSDTSAYSASSIATSQNQLRVNNAGASGVAGILLTAEPSSGSAGHASIRATSHASGSADLIFSTRNASTFGEKIRVKYDGKISIGGPSNDPPGTPDGNLHVQDGSAGSVTADTAGNLAVFEDSASNGISILVPSDERANIYFGTPGTGGQIEAGIQYAHESVSTAADRRDMIFRAGGGEKVRIQGTGGISFGGDTASNFALDDYDEGTWTPNVLDGNGSNYTIQVDTARYTKIGRLVHCHYQIKRTENGSKTGTLRISNIPFAHDGTSIQGGNWWCDHGSPTDGLGDIIGGIHSIGSGSSSVYFVKPTDESGMGTASSRYLEHGQWTLNRWIYGSFIYYSAT